MQKIILASQSPRRKQLLEWAAINFEVEVSAADESYPKHLPVEAIPVFIAGNKAKAVQHKLNTDLLILGADTIVVLNDKIITKPVNRTDAVKILQSLSAKQHKVITGVVLLQHEKEISFAETTLVEFYNLTNDQIIFYVDNYKPYDKAGAYAIQEWIGVVGVKSITGDFYNVMGLPVSRVMQAINKF